MQLLATNRISERILAAPAVAVAQQAQLFF